MTRARKELISLCDTPYYHCMARCVRRAFLFGEDSVTGRRYDHRKQWIVDRVTGLAGVFAIDVCAYAVMSNHYHLVLRVDEDTLNRWTDREVIDRWMSLFSGHPVVDKFLMGETSAAEDRFVGEMVEKWRGRLGEISWFMRCLNEKIARMANAEDGCRGRFWEGRFKSQALLDETAVLACMAYVDLNPVRSGLCDSLEASDFTSIQARLRSISFDKAKRSNGGEPSLLGQSNQAITPDLKAVSQNNTDQIPFPEIGITLKEYVDLVEWTGLMIRDDKRGALRSDGLSVLERLSIDEGMWLGYVPVVESGFSEAVGTVLSLQRLGEKLGRGWLQGQGVMRRLCQGSQIAPIKA